MKVSAERLGPVRPAAAATSLSKPLTVRPIAADAEAHRPSVSLSRPGSGAFRVTPPLTLKSDEMAIARATHDAGEDVERARAVRIRPPDHLVHDAVDAVIAAMEGRC